MTHYKAIITEKTASGFGEIIANTKSPSKLKGLSKEDFIEAVCNETCYEFKVEVI
jgi:hypothetical protein